MTSRRLGMVGVALMLAVAVGWWWVSHGRLAGWHPALNSREIATRVLAENLGQRFPAAKMLVFGNPFSQRPGQSPEIYAFESAERRGLLLGLGRPADVRMAYPALRREFLERPESVFVDPKTTTPLSFLVADDAFDQIAQANSDCDLLVSLIGVPVQLRQQPIWREREKRHFGLLLPDWRLVGKPEEVREAIKSEKVAAAVLRRPGAATDEQFDARAPYQEEFARFYFLVTKDNVDELMQMYPQLF